MLWADVLVVPPRAEPMHLEEARQHIRLTEDDPRDEDGLIEGWIASARESAEDETGRQLVLATWELVLNGFPPCGAIVLPHPPLRQVVSITYTDADGDDTSMSLDDVIVDAASEPGRIALKHGKSWPTSRLQAQNGVVIRYKAGYAVPFTASASDDTIEAIDHWLEEGSRVRVWNTGGLLPAPLKPQTDYYVVEVDGNLLKLSATMDGEVIDIKLPGDGTHFIGVIPEGIRAAMKLTLGSRFEHREDIIVGVSAQEMPQAAKSLLWPRRVWYSGPEGVT